MKIIDIILRKGYLRSRIYRVLESFSEPGKGQNASQCAAYGSEFLDDEVRMIDQPMKKNIASKVYMGDFAQLGQVPYMLVPFYGEDEVDKTKANRKAEKKYSFLNSNIMVVNPVRDDSEQALASEIPFPWNQFKLYALSQNIETH